MSIDRIAPTQRPGGRVVQRPSWRDLAWHLRRGRIHHDSYPLQTAEVTAWEESLLAAAGIVRFEGEPLARYASRLEICALPVSPRPPSFRRRRWRGRTRQHTR